MAKTIKVDVVYAKPHNAWIVPVLVRAGTTMQEAILQSKILTVFPEIDLVVHKIGVFSRFVKLSDVVSAGDRIEIYQPLLANPKEIRRKRSIIPSKKSIRK